MEVCQRGKSNTSKNQQICCHQTETLRTPELSQVVSNAEGASGDTRHCVLDALREVNDSRNHFRHHHHSLEHPTTLPPPKDFFRSLLPISNVNLQEID
ncbi:hypothetical protein CEXT_34111 [Caerostris extrusa]|uniref:Uncharacterized protein n=1 Tax=Caerostris extrusa TaxID=172846 RepID=A0AAV4V310_CAEEX|nr:hypothetical protein CEXT_34111 [Caerostris extrusa]